MRINKKICFVTGAGHSGSTLLGLILGSHTNAFYCGEAGKTRYLGNPLSPDRKKFCKFCGRDCKFWGGYILKKDIDIYEQLSKRSGCSLIIDSTKNIKWLEDMCIELESTTAKKYLIFLIRDGRAVVNSRLRKYPTRGPEKIIRDWYTQISTMEEFYLKFAGPKLIVFYEKLATSPQSVVKTVCKKLDISYQPKMLRFSEHEHHVLGGNNGTQYIVARQMDLNKSKSNITVSKQHKGYYENHPNGIKLDLRWKKELDLEILKIFKDIAGEKNRELMLRGVDYGEN